MLAAEQDSDMVAHLSADSEFHARFLALHGNEQIVQAVRRARARSRMRGLLVLAKAGRLHESTLEHHAMVDSAIAGDREGMERLVRRHIERVRHE